MPPQSPGNDERLSPNRSTPPAEEVTHRILLVDDNPSIHADFRKILCPNRPLIPQEHYLESLLFDQASEKPEEVRFELESAYQGQEAVEKVRASLAQQRPFALAFVDVRMPPGWDGVQTVSHLWELDPHLQIVICTAYSDYSWHEMRSRLGRPDSLVVLKKPFDNIEVQQLAHALTRKWELNLQADLAVNHLEHTVQFLQTLLGQHAEAGLGPPDGAPAAVGATVPSSFPPCQPQATPTRTFSRTDFDGRVRRLAAHTQLALALCRIKEALDTAVGRLRDTELHLVQAEKLISLGRMSAGITHEINNPLNFAIGALEFLGRYAGRIPADNRQDFLDVLNDLRLGLQRISKIVTDLRGFCSPQHAESEPVRVATTVTTALRFLQMEVKDQVEVTQSIPEDFTVHAVSSRLLQVLLNLLQNSLDALRTKTFTPGTRPQIRLKAGCEAGAKVIRLWDNGPGIRAEHLGRIFDPFFTTKEVGKGTGLGLSLCYRLLREMGADIFVRSEEGEYCEFTLTFPMAVGEAATPPAAHSCSESPRPL